VLDIGVAKAIERPGEDRCRRQCAAAPSPRRARCSGTAATCRPSRPAASRSTQRTDLFSLGHRPLRRWPPARYPFPRAHARPRCSLPFCATSRRCAHRCARAAGPPRAPLIHRCMLKTRRAALRLRGRSSPRPRAVRREARRGACPPRPRAHRRRAGGARPRRRPRRRASSVTSPRARRWRVLPSSDLAAAPTTSSEGLDEELITAVASGRLRVISRQSVMRFRGSDKPSRPTSPASSASTTCSWLGAARRQSRAHLAAARPAPTPRSTVGGALRARHRRTVAVEC
jgi:hypothetical protein